MQQSWKIMLIARIEKLHRQDKAVGNVCCVTFMAKVLLLVTPVKLWFFGAFAWKMYQYLSQANAVLED